jgi:hypothetical protein
VTGRIAGYVGATEWRFRLDNSCRPRVNSRLSVKMHVDRYRLTSGHAGSVYTNEQRKGTCCSGFMLLTRGFTTGGNGSSAPICRPHFAVFTNHNLGRAPT